jgi:hypothetical protein
MFSFTGITIITQSVFLILNFVPESPVSLIEMGELKEARRVLSMFNSDDVIENVFAEYVNLAKRKNF